MRNTLVFSTLLATILLSAGASAQSKTAIAEELYNKGKAALDAGQISEACKKFGESQRLDPATGTLFALATCHEKEGKSASAWGEFIEVAELYKKAGKADREAAARDAASRLEKALIRITLTMPNRPKDVEIKLDGTSLSDGILGSAIPVDPGEHNLVVTAAGKKPYEQAFKIDKGTANTKVEIPALVDLPPEAKTPPPPPNTVVVQPPQDDPGAARRTIGWLTLGGGVVIGGVGLALELGSVLPKAKEAKDEKDKLAGPIGDYIKSASNGLGSCDDAMAKFPNLVNSDNGKAATATCDKYKSAKSLETVNIVLGVVGGVAVVTGIVLIVTSFGSKPEPKKAASTFTLTPLVGPTSAGLAGTF